MQKQKTYREKPRKTKNIFLISLFFSFFFLQNSLKVFLIPVCARRNEPRRYLIKTKQSKKKPLEERSCCCGAE
jgi:hypothetical protein